MKSRKVLKEVKKWLRANIDSVEHQMYDEGLVIDNERLLEHIEKLEKLPDVKGGIEIEEVNDE